MCLWSRLNLITTHTRHFLFFLTDVPLFSSSCVLYSEIQFDFGGKTQRCIHVCVFAAAQFGPRVFIKRYKVFTMPSCAFPRLRLAVSVVLCFSVRAFAGQQLVCSSDSLSIWWEYEGKRSTILIHTVILIERLLLYNFILIE